MADITQTAASVAAASAAPFQEGTAGATIVAGDVLYKDSSSSEQLKLAINSAEASAEAVGVALNGGATGQPIRYQTGGNINPGGTVTIGESYFVSPQAGKFAPDADVASGRWVTGLGVGVSSSLVALRISISGVQVP